jgi:uncharacterized membrane protein
VTEPPSTFERDIGRLEAFSDGIFGIAATLLVLDVRVPRAEGDLVAALLAQWPSYVGYAGSFIIIGIWWAGHHSMLDMVRRSDHALRLFNLMHLLCIGFLPFATGLVAEYLNTGGRQFTIATVVYVGTLLLAAVTFNLIWRCSVSGGLLNPGLTPGLIERINRVNLLSLGSYLVAFVAAFVLPIVALAICFGIALYYGLPRRRLH